jgi:hypothetical protein
MKSAALLTYGDMVDSLIFLDQAKLNANQEEWLERWNEVMLVSSAVNRTA